MPRKSAAPAARTTYIADENLPSQVRVLRIPAVTPTWELRWREPGSGDRDTHRVHHSGHDAETEADKLATRLRDGLAPHIGRAVRAAAKMVAPLPRPRTVLRTLMSVEAEWAAQYHKKNQSLKSAQYNLEHYVYSTYTIFSTDGSPTNDSFALSKMALDDIEESHIHIWLRSMTHTHSALGRPYSSSTRALALRNLNTLLNFAVKKKYLESNPASDVKVDLYDVKKKDSFEDMAEFMSVFRHLPNWAKAPVIVLLYSGARFGEGAALTVGALDLIQFRIYFERTLLSDGTLSTPKSVESQNFVPFHQSLAPYLQQHVDGLRNAGPNDRLFIGQRGGRQLHNRSLNTVLKNACERAGLEKRVTCHGLRRSVASWLNANGVPTVTIQKILRHADVRTTISYIDVHESQRVSAMATLPAIPAGAL